MQLSLFIFRPQDGPAFEVWAPRVMRQVDAPENTGALLADTAQGFAPNLVLGHNRVAAEMTLQALAGRLQQEALALPGAELRQERAVAGTAGTVRVVAFTHAGLPESGPLYQMTACLLAPSLDRDGELPQRHLVYLTGTCTVDQIATWDPAFVDAAGSVRFG